MLDWWDKEAADLQRMGFGNYPTESATREDAYRVALHTRQDLVLVVSLLSSLNKQAREIKILLAVIACILLAAVGQRQFL